MTENKNKQNNNDEIVHKIQSLREMIDNAERTIQASKAMLLQLEGKKKTGRKRKVEDVEGGKVVEGAFDGQIMIGSDGKQYPVPANYASKSKLVEGDLLKLTITDDGNFIYKQIGPAERKRLIGVVSQDEKGNYFVMAEGRPYQILLASITYFKAEPGDEVTLIIPRDIDSNWGSVENIIKRGSFETLKETMRKKPAERESAKKNEAINSKGIIDEWTPDLEELKKEIDQDKDKDKEN